MPVFTVTEQVAFLVDTNLISEKTKKYFFPGNYSEISQLIGALKNAFLAVHCCVLFGIGSRDNAMARYESELY